MLEKRIRSLVDYTEHSLPAQIPSFWGTTVDGTGNAPEVNGT